MSRRRLKQSPQTRLSQRTVLIYAAAVTLVTIAIGVGVFIYINLGNSHDSYANGNSDYISSGTGNWEDATTWRRRRPDLPDTPGEDTWSWDENTIRVTGTTIDVGGYVTRSGNLWVGSGTTMIISDTLRVIGDLTISNADLTIEEEGLLIVVGDFNTIAEANTTNNGQVVTMGDVDNQGAWWRVEESSIQNNNNFYVIGETNGGGSFNGENNPNNANFRSEDQLMQENPQLYEFASGMTVMPITLAYFRAKQEGGQTLLEWGTVNEENNDFFTIERSRDAKQFEILDKVTGAGNSDVELEYEYVDDQPLSGPNYYRLKQTDFNGDFEYFNIVVVHHEEIAGSTASISIDRIGPNPFQQQFTIHFTIRESADVRLSITNANGQQVAEALHRAYAGPNEINYQEGNRLNTGIYLVTLSYDNYTSEPVRLIKR